MPKKFGENTKSAAGKERKAAAAADKQARENAVKAKKEDEYWAEGAKDSSKKQLEEQKRLEKLAKKKEKEELEAKERAELDKIKKSKSPDAIATRGADKKAAKMTAKVEAHETAKAAPVEYQARGLDAALELMSLATDSGATGLAASSSSSVALNADRHPERRVKAALSAFEEREMPILREENPTLRRSQLKELLWKKWQKAPENPMNQQLIGHNMTSEEARQMIEIAKEERLKDFLAQPQRGYESD